MVAKSVRMMMLGDRREASPADGFKASEPDESFPAAGMVLREMLTTLAGFLTIALLLHALVEGFGL